MNRCRSCNAEVVWAVTEKGKRMPVDALPVEDGNVTLHPALGSRNLAPIAVVHPVGQLPFGADEARYTSHFATCPDAD